MNCHWVYFSSRILIDRSHMLATGTNGSVSEGLEKNPNEFKRHEKHSLRSASDNIGGGSN